MAQKKPAGNSNKTKVKNVYVDRYADKARGTWEARKRVIDTLPSNTGLSASVESNTTRKQKSRGQVPTEELTQ